MIPDALSSTGPFAGFWAHLKSIDHALCRALDSKSSLSLTELDKERLRTMADFLRESMPAQTPSPALPDFATAV